jgi:hypothetical protein
MAGFGLKGVRRAWEAMIQCGGPPRGRIIEARQASGLLGLLKRLALICFRIHIWRVETCSAEITGIELNGVRRAWEAVIRLRRASQRSHYQAPPFSGAGFGAEGVRRAR